MKQPWQQFRFDIGPYNNSFIFMQHAISDFSRTVLSNLTGENTVLFMFKIQTDQGFRSITHLQKFNFNQKPEEFGEFDLIDAENTKTLADLLTLCEESFELVSDRYQEFKIKYIVFSYKIIPSGEVKEITKTSKLENNFVRHAEALEIKSEPQIYKGHHLPKTMDFTK